MKDYPTPPDGLVVTRHDGVLEVRLDRPERRNAFTDQMVLALTDTIEAAGSDPSVRVVSMTGAGEHFCSGFDLGERSGEPGRAGATQRQMRWHVNRLIPALLETQTPIVAGVRGWAVGLGLHLALAADFAVVAENARLWAPFSSFGFTPDSGGSWMIPRLVGVARAKEILMLGREISGARAFDAGLVYRSVPDDELDAELLSLTNELATAATVAVGLTKSLVHRALNAGLVEHLAAEALTLELASRSDDFHESARARREKRPPHFTGT